MKAPKFNMKHLKKAEGHIGRNVESISMKMETIINIPRYSYPFQKIILFLFIYFLQKNGSVRDSRKAPKFNVKHLKKAEGHIGRNVESISMKMKTILNIPRYSYPFQKIILFLFIYFCTRLCHIK